jgi:hypothetical protein
LLVEFVSLTEKQEHFLAVVEISPVVVCEVPVFFVEASEVDAAYLLGPGFTERSCNVSVFVVSVDENPVGGELNEVVRVDGT